MIQIFCLLISIILIFVTGLYYNNESSNETSSRDITTLTLQGILLLFMIFTLPMKLVTIVLTLIYGYVSWDFFSRHNLSKERDIVLVLILSALLLITIKPGLGFK